MGATVTHLNAKAKVYLNTEEQDFPGESPSPYGREIVYPPEHDTVNRRGRKWHVLDIGLESIYRPIRRQPELRLRGQGQQPVPQCVHQHAEVHPREEDAVPR